MFFKPKIFISSVLSIESIRNSIEAHFKNVGAEVLLYEKNLTPSVNKESYKQDILDSDFVIMILDKTYGSKTSSGISGTHEEYEIIKNTKIPMHVYIKKNETISNDLQIFINEVSNDRVSYFLYKNEKDLIKRIVETTFQISKEISLNDLDLLKIPSNKVLKLMTELDYSLGITLIRDFTDILDAIVRVHLSDTETDIWNAYFESKFDYYYNHKRWYFIDSETDFLYKKLLDSYYEYSSFAATVYVYGNATYKTKLRSSIELEFNKLKVNNSFDDTIQVQELFDSFVSCFRELEKKIMDQKKRSDLYS